MLKTIMCAVGLMATSLTGQAQISSGADPCPDFFKMALQHSRIDWQRTTVRTTTLQNGKTLITEKDSFQTGRITIPLPDGKAESILTPNREFSRLVSTNLSRDWQYKYVDSTKHAQFFSPKTLDSSKYSFTLVDCQAKNDTLLRGQIHRVATLAYTTAFESQEALFTQTTLWIEPKSGKVTQVYSKITDRDGKIKEQTTEYDIRFSIDIPSQAQPFVRDR